MEAFDLKYLNRRFSVPAAGPKVTQGEWEDIFGSEEERKEKLAKAIEETKERKKNRRMRKDEVIFDDNGLMARAADATDGFNEHHEEALEKICQRTGIPEKHIKGIKDSTAARINEQADRFRQGGGYVTSEDN